MSEVEKFLNSCRRIHTMTHLYLTRNHVEPFNLFVDKNDNLIIPAINVNNKYVDYQSISKNGMFCTRQVSVDGSFHPLQKPHNKEAVVKLFDNYAQAAKQKDLTNVLCVFYCNNFKHVVSEMHNKLQIRDFELFGNNLFSKEIAKRVKEEFKDLNISVV